jgi:hypothetical protein
MTSRAYLPYLVGLAVLIAAFLWIAGRSGPSDQNAGNPKQPCKDALGRISSHGAVIDGPQGYLECRDGKWVATR